jgi:hypothetical protein
LLIPIADFTLDPFPAEGIGVINQFLIRISHSTIYVDNGYLVLRVRFYNQGRFRAW